MGNQELMDLEGLKGDRVRGVPRVPEDHKAPQE